jgi:3-hydroxyacyl-[acyl-carrier-protein] dehydratase
MQKNKLPDIEEILKYVPHRYPFLLIDRIIDFDQEERITGLKNITYNEWYFQGLPEVLRIVPALILCEAVAQLGCLLLFQNEENRGKIIFFTGIDHVRFRVPVRAGDTLILTAKIRRRKGRIGRFSVEGKVGEKLAFEGVMGFAIE